MAKGKSDGAAGKAEGGFEAELAKLQDAVGRLERPDLTLEEAFKCMEEGGAAYLACRKLLAETRSRVELLVKEFPEQEGAWQPFAWEGGDGGARAAAAGGEAARGA